MMDDEKQKVISKFLTKVLRHTPQKFGLTLSEKGYCKLDDLYIVIMKNFRGEVTKAEISYVLLNSKWQGTVHRFDVWRGWVRATYKHTCLSSPVRLPQGYKPHKAVELDYHI